MSHLKDFNPYILNDENNARAVGGGLAEATWYRSRVAPDAMRRLMARRDGPAIRDTAIWFGLIFASGAAGAWLWGTAWAILPFAVYGVLYASSSDSRWHESSHGTAFKTDWLNNALYEIASFMVLRESTPWRWSHSRHHSDTLVVGRDPEIAVPRPPDFKRMVLGFFSLRQAQAYFDGVLHHVFGRMREAESRYIPRSEYPSVFWKARLYLAIYLGVVGLAIWQRSLLPLMFIGLPQIYGAWLMPIYGYTQHAGLAENVLDHRLNCRTVRMNPVNRFLYWNMNYHIEHHMFPMVPYHRLPELHALLAADMPPPYPSLWAAWKEIIMALRRQAKDPSWFVVRPLPTAPPSHMKEVRTARGPDAEGWFEAGPCADLEKGSVMRCDAGGRTFAISRTEDGRLFATDGICTHGNTHLADGLVKGDQLECPKHNGRFRLEDGEPARKPVCVGLTVHPVREHEGSLWLKPVARESSLRAGEGPYEMKVVSNRLVTPLIRELIVEPPAGAPLPIYQSGQYMQVEIPAYPSATLAEADLGEWRTFYEKQGFLRQASENPAPVRRNYSMASDPSRDRHLKFNIRFATAPASSSAPSGVGSTWVHRLKPGDRVNAFGPFGDFLIKESAGELVYLGGGAGMAPLRSHLAQLLETRGTQQKVSFWYGARAKADLYYLDYFAALASAHPRFSFHPVLSEAAPDDAWQGPTGFVHEALRSGYLAGHPDPRSIEYFLCGPPAMMKAARAMLASLGVPDERVSFDEF